MSEELMGFEDLEELLRDTSRAVAVPPTPRIAVAVRVRITTAPVPSLWRRLLASPSGPRRRPVLVALAVVLVLLAGALAVPPVRDTLAHFFHVSGLGLQRSPHAIPTPGGTPTGPGQLGLGTKVSLADARRQASFAVGVPGALGEPDEVYVLKGVSGVAVTLVYLPRAGLPAAGTTGVGALITELPGSLNPPYLMKFADAQTRIEEVTVGQAPGYWISGHPHQVLVNLGQDVHPEEIRLAGDTLVWTDFLVVKRIESKLGRDAAIRIGLSMR